VSSDLMFFVVTLVDPRPQPFSRVVLAEYFLSLFSSFYLILTASPNPSRRARISPLELLVWRLVTLLICGTI